MIGEIGSSLGGLVQGLFVDLGDAVVFADKQDDHRRATDKQRHFDDFFGKIAHRQTHEKGSTDIGQQKGGGKNIQ